MFVSSTFVDLQDERAVVVAGLQKMDAIPAGMELFPAADDSAWTLIERVIDASDYYLLVIGGRYGSVDAETELSYTEREYNYAVKVGKPVMAFVHGDPGNIVADKVELEKEPRAKLEAFRKKVTNAKHVNFWTTPAELQAAVLISYADFRQRYDAVGWVRGDVQTTSESLSEINALRKELDAARAEIKEIASGPPPGTEGLAQGDDSVRLTVTIRARVLGKSVQTWRSRKFKWNVSITWDELFSVFGPDLLDEAEQVQMRDRLDEYLTERYAQEAQELLRTNLDEHGLRSIGTVTLEVQNDPFGTVLVQLVTLGLMRKSGRRRSVADTGTYWSLTPYGETHLISLRAIRRTDAVEPDAEEAPQEPDADSN